MDTKEQEGLVKSSAFTFDSALIKKSINEDSLMLVKHNLRNAFLDGDLNEIELLVYAKRLAKAIEETIKDDTVKEAISDRYNRMVEGKSVKIGDIEVKEAPTYTKYDYSVCHHSELDFINNAILALSERAKVIESELKNIKDGQTKAIIIEDVAVDILKQVLSESNYGAGEVVICNPPVKIQTMGFKVSGL